MKLEYISKSQEYDSSGTASHTKVVLGNTDGAIYPIFLPADKINLSNSELLDLALDEIYQANFPMRAENEKFNTLEDKVAQVDKLIVELEETIATTKKEAKEGLEANQHTLDTAVAELTGLIMGMMGIEEPVGGQGDEEDEGTIE